jgi:hypothetical protein
MSPKDVSEILRRIAGAIDKSKQPSLDKVRHDIGMVISKIAEEQQQSQQQDQAQQQQSQQEQQALPSSPAGKQMIDKMLDDLQSAYKGGDHVKFKELLGKLDRAAETTRSK